MEETNPQLAQVVHPIQHLVNRFAPFLGFFTALFLALITIFSIWLVINSAEAIGGVVYLITLIVALVVFAMQRYLLSFTKRNTLFVGGKKVDYLTLMIVPLLIFGFVQTFFWVIDSSEPIHKPRSVFILASAGILEFVRSQIEKVESKSRLVEEA